jgi:serine/threonine protein kinase
VWVLGTLESTNTVILSGPLQRPSDDNELKPGQSLGPYELLVPVGAGGMAHVWAARHRGSGIVFALKMLMPHLAHNSAFRDMFFDEARIAQRIHHENVARTYELVDLEGILTLVMEWVDGSSLINILRPGGKDQDDAPRVALPIRHAVRILAETCAGLHAAHELVGDDGRHLAVVHRDVSPHNILLMRDGRVKVTDFGVAKAVGKSHMTIAGQVKGKLAYMSPEQLVGGGIDRRSDIFALGSVLYETTTGERPFQGEHDPQIMAAIVMGNFMRPSEIVRTYPAALEDIIMRALANEPDARFATALQLKQALEGWLATSGPPIGAPHVSILLQERCGPELESRVGVYSLTQAAPPGSAPDANRPSDLATPRGGMSRTTTARGGRPEGPSTPAMIIAMLVGVVLGLAVLVYVKNVRRERRAAAENAFADAGPTLVVPATKPAVSTTGAREDGRPDGGVNLAPVRSREVTLRTPPNARLFVDGRELPPGTSTVPRPASGVVTVLVRADTREDTLVELKPTSPDEVEVVMADKPKPRPIKAPTPSPDPASSITTPPNPYD